MKEQLETANSAETLYRVTVTNPAKWLLGIAAKTLCETLKDNDNDKK